MKILIFIVSIAGLSTGYSQSNAQLQKQITVLQAQVLALQRSSVQALAPFVIVDPNPQVGVSGPNITFHGANVHIVSGTSANDGRGLGNLIIGTDEDPAVIGTPLQAGERNGSNNLIIGRWNKFNTTAFGGIVAGEGNTISGEGNSVLGGGASVVSGTQNVVVGGSGNAVHSSASVVVGGQGNEAAASCSVVLGGFSCYVYPNALDAVVLGGTDTTISVGYNVSP